MPSVRLHLCWVFVLVGVPVLSAQSLTQSLGANSYVDWQRFVVHATGNSVVGSQERTQKVEALERARIAAEQNLVSAIQKLPFNSQARVEDLIASDSGLQNALGRFVKRFTILDTRSMSDMSVELDIELPFLEHLLPLFLPNESGTAALRLTDQPLCPTCGQPWPEGRPVPEGVKLIVPSEGYTRSDGKPFTGLVVDARSLKVQQVVAPRILNEEQEEIYGANYIVQDAAFEHGVIAYATSLSKAMKDQRIGPAPLLVQAKDVVGQIKADIIVSNDDAVLIHAAAKNENFLKDGRVIIVTGR